MRRSGPRVRSLLATHGTFFVEPEELPAFLGAWQERNEWDRQRDGYAPTERSPDESARASPSISFCPPVRRVTRAIGFGLLARMIWASGVAGEYPRMRWARLLKDEGYEQTCLKD